MKILGYDRPLYILAFDHRGSFVTKMFGWHDDLTPEQIAEIAAPNRPFATASKPPALSRKWIGAFAATLGGLDTLVFTGGIGENAPTVRARICNGLGFLGIELEEKRNAANEDVIFAGATVHGR